MRIFLGRDGNGKRQFHNHTVHGTKSDAQKYLNGVLRERDLGQFVDSKITIDTLLDALLLDYKINGRDYDWAELVTRCHLRPYFGQLVAAKLTTDSLRSYIRMRQEKGTANATINRALALLRRAYNPATEADPPKVGRVPNIPALEENNTRKGFFEHDSFVALRRQLPEEIRPVLTFAYYTGCRRGEILMLEWSQVDLAEQVIRLEPGETKNKEARVFHLAPELLETLRMQKALRDQKHPYCQWVFFRNGRPILEFKNSWETACKAAGLVTPTGDHVHVFHDLRRTGVRNLIRAGVPEKVAMIISGHKTRSVFDRYNIVDERDLKEAAAKLGRYHAERHTIVTQPADGDCSHECRKCW